MAVLISLDVILRNLGVASFSWLLELSEYALYVATFLAAPWVLHLGAHVRVDLVVSSVPRHVARLLEVLANLLGLAVAATLGWYGWRVASVSFARGDVLFTELVVQEWILLIFIPLSCLLLTIEFAFRVRASLRAAPAVGDDDSLKEGF
jgi:TRAP-type C4-dicarboxylate transport system permease small subunit